MKNDNWNIFIGKKRNDGDESDLHVSWFINFISEIRRDSNCGILKWLILKLVNVFSSGNHRTVPVCLATQTFDRIFGVLVAVCVSIFFNLNRHNENMLTDISIDAWNSNSRSQPFMLNRKSILSLFKLQRIMSFNLNCARNRFHSAWRTGNVLWLCVNLLC